MSAVYLLNNQSGFRVGRMKLGLISDTHGQVPNAVHAALAGVDYILHGGDVGPMDVITELEAIAPVRAVLGNTDYGIQLPETRLEEFGDKKVMIHHIVDVDCPSQQVRAILNSDQPDIVVSAILTCHLMNDATESGLSIPAQPAGLVKIHRLRWRF